MTSIPKLVTLALLTGGLAITAASSQAAECKPSKWGAED